LTTAIDANVLLDIVFPASPRYDPSLAALNEAEDAGALVISEAVYASPATSAQSSALWRFFKILELASNPRALPHS
jgi:predicted nucleic acid-binding protein